MTVYWLNPAALAGLALVAGPVLVHLLRRRPARRVPFPSVRFIAGANTATARPRRLSDPLLLLVRCAIVAGAAVALAGPIFVAPARRAAWDKRLSRAVVVDASASMAAAAARARETATAERAGATHVVTIETNDLAGGAAWAAEQLRSAPPSRREVVIISDLQSGSVTAAALDAIPASFGVRFVDVGALPSSRTVRGSQTFGVGDVAGRSESIEISGRGTAVRLTPGRAARDGVRVDGGREAEALLRAVALAGAPAPAPDEPIALTLAPVSIESRLRPWMTRAALEMRRDARLMAAAREHRAPPAAGSPSLTPWFVIARGAGGDPVVLGGARGPELVILVRAAPGEFLPRAALRSALLARRTTTSWQEQEIERVPANVLQAWSRAPQPFLPGPESLHAQDESDGRLVWLLVLGLLVVESVARGTRRNRTREKYADAA